MLSVRRHYQRITPPFADYATTTNHQINSNLCGPDSLCYAVLAAAGSGLAGSGGLNPEQLHRPDALHLPAAEAGGA